MHKAKILETFTAVKEGRLSVEKAVERLSHLPYEDLSFAKVDHHRHLVQGIPEVILASGKKTSEVAEIARSMYRKSRRLLITKASEEVYRGLKLRGAVFHPSSGMITAGMEIKSRKGLVLVISAGTSDIPVAEEAAVTASFLGSNVETVYDIGIAGIHRVLDKRKLFSSARAIVVVAGMEGALPSVVGGLTDRPIIAVPSSTGYGASLGGFTALFAMLNSCVPGIAVMNIDNGFGGGCLAHRINTI